jgi:hypothetical protein
MVRLRREAYGIGGSFLCGFGGMKGDLFFELLVRQRKEGAEWCEKGRRTNSFWG